MPTAGIFPFNRPGSSFPLKSSTCHYRLVDIQVLATLVQEYESDSFEDESVSYVFPLPPDAGVCSFKAVIDDQRVISGLVKEKGVAKAEYEEAVAEGKTAGLLEKQHADVFQVFLGNIRPGQRIAVHISFVAIIGHDAASSDSLRLMIPVNIAPRYGTPPQGVPIVSPTKCLSVTVSVQMTGNIKSITSPTHPIALSLGTNTPDPSRTYDPKLAHISLESDSFLGEDIVLVLAVEDLDRPRCIIESDESSGTDAYALTFVPRFNLPPLPQQDYIFLIDRSGSMKGSRIAAVRIALQIMLKSLPTRGTTFNLWSFGNACTSLWPTSQQYSAQTVSTAVAHVDCLKADYGGTKIERALKGVFDNVTSRPQELIVPTTVIVLTDGESWNLNEVLARVRGAAEKAEELGSFVRSFVLGIGNGVSKPMCDGIARAGSGQAVYVAENEKPEGKLVNLLKAARGGVIRDLKVDWGVANGVPEINDTKETAIEDDDGFELVPSETEMKPELKPIINLFDESGTGQIVDIPLSPTAPIVLPPPPRIQQAPVMTRLSIPLYPGFRTSIFAIVKRDVPASSMITITGAVLGQSVSLSIPVIVSQSSTVESSDGHIFHTLAARALIQDWEDQSASPERDAQIVRLGTTYSLASSQTSFVAVDRPSPENRVLESEVDYHISKSPTPTLLSAGALDTAPPRVHKKRHTKKRILEGVAKGVEVLELPGPRSFAHLAAEISHEPEWAVLSSWPAPEYRSGADVISNDSNTPTLSPSASVSSPFVNPFASAPLTKRTRPQKASSFSLKPLASQVSLFSRTSSAYVPPQQCDVASPLSTRSKLLGGIIIRKPNSKPTSMGAQIEAPLSVSDPLAVTVPTCPPTLERIARAASFDGSFEASALEGGLSAIPSPPKTMSSLLATTAGTFSQSDAAWITMLVLEYLKKYFSDQRDAWEILEEKGVEFVKDLLKEAGVIEANVVENLIVSWRAVANTAL